MRTLFAFLAIAVAGCATVRQPELGGPVPEPAPSLPAPAARTENLANAGLLDGARRRRGRAPRERRGFARARAQDRAAQSAPVAGARARAPEAGRLRAGREHRRALQLLGWLGQRLARRELAFDRARARGARRRGGRERRARSGGTAEVSRGGAMNPCAPARQAQRIGRRRRRGGSPTGFRRRASARETRSGSR